MEQKVLYGPTRVATRMTMQPMVVWIIDALVKSILKCMQLFAKKSKIIASQFFSYKMLPFVCHFRKFCSFFVVTSQIIYILRKFFFSNLGSANNMSFCITGFQLSFDTKSALTNFPQFKISDIPLLWCKKSNKKPLQIKYFLCSFYIIYPFRQCCGI